MEYMRMSILKCNWFSLVWFMLIDAGHQCSEFTLAKIIFSLWWKERIVCSILSCVWEMTEVWESQHCQGSQPLSATLSHQQVISHWALHLCSWERAIGACGSENWSCLLSEGCHCSCRLDITASQVSVCYGETSTDWLCGGLAFLKQTLYLGL